MQSLTRILQELMVLKHKVSNSDALSPASRQAANDHIEAVRLIVTAAMSEKHAGPSERKG